MHQQNTATYLSPYTFSGKERDVEMRSIREDLQKASTTEQTSLSYFGARYYDASLSIWLSVDPLSDKYPSLSAYNYCALNPVMLVDPDGQEIEEAADPPKFWERIKNFFSSSVDCFKNFDAPNPNKAPKGGGWSRNVYRHKWIDIESNMDGDHDMEKEYRLSRHRKTRITYDTHEVPDEIKVHDDRGNSVSTGQVSGEGKINLKKGPRSIKVEVVANKNNDTVYNYTVQQKAKVITKKIEWSWTGILPRRTVTRFN